MSDMIRGGGKALIVGAALLVLTNTVLTPLMPVDGPESVLRASGIYLYRMIGALLTAIVLIFGAIGLHLAQRHKAGRLGAIAFVTLIVGIVLLVGLEWFNLFGMHALAHVAPDALEALDEALTLNVGFALSAGLFALGWILMSISLLRSAALPRHAPALTLAGLFAVPLLAASPLGPLVGQIVGNLVLGAGFASLGLALLRHREGEAT